VTTSRHLPRLVVWLLFAMYLFCGTSSASFRASCQVEGPKLQRIPIGEYVLQIQRVDYPDPHVKPDKAYACKFSVGLPNSKSFYDVSGYVGENWSQGNYVDVEIFGTDVPDLNGDGVPDLVFRRPGGRACTERFSIVLLGSEPTVLVDFRFDSALSVEYSNSKRQIFSPSPRAGFSPLVIFKFGVEPNCRARPCQRFDYV
jgi:hypothetical protein